MKISLILAPILAMSVSLMALMTSVPVLAGPAGPAVFVSVPNFNEADKARIARGTAALQALGTVKGRFRQTDYRNRTSEGGFALARPGRMRLDFDPPFDMTVISDGKSVHVVNPRLKTMDHYPLSETPLSLFLAKQIRFDQGVIITRVATTATGFTLMARDRRVAVDGSVSLDFSQGREGEPARLTGWTLVDAQGHATRIELLDLNPASAAPGLFIFKPGEFPTH